ncbi:hypothetical protein [Spirobacillus cienkowskii]|uniref:hypothetical protein n=1 Tax=Spirobacillus cienkowskii TaxID=495820 RepID=UPI0030D41EC4
MSFKKLFFVFLLSIYPLSSDALNYNYFDIDDETSNIFYSKGVNGENGKDGEDGGNGGNGGNGG